MSGPHLQALIARLDRVEEVLGITGALPTAVLDDPRPLRVGAIIQAVAYEMGLRPIEIMGDRRHQHLRRARAAVTWLAREITTASYPHIGSVMGGRDHSTILNQHKVGQRLRVSDPAFRMVTNRLAQQFQHLKEH